MHEVTMWADRWAMGLVLVVSGVVLFWKPRQPLSLKQYFSADELTLAVRAVIAERESAEALSDLYVLVPGVVLVLAGVLVLLGYIFGPTAFGLSITVLGVSLSMAYVRMRNRGRRRAAFLERRAPASVIPFQWYAAGAIAAASPLVFISTLPLRASIIGVTVGALLVLVVTLALNAMPAIMAGDDVETERFVDERVRQRRITNALAGSFTIPLIFVPAIISAHTGLLPIIVYWYDLIAWTWYWFRLRTPFVEPSS